MKNVIKDNFGLKLLSLGIAILLWLVVVNVSKPEITDSRTVNVTVRNTQTFDKDAKTWQIDKDKVKISYRVRTDVATSITPDDFSVYVDLEDYSITGSVPVYVEILNGKDGLIDDVTPNPQVIKVDIENVQEKKFSVKSEALGTPSDGYLISSIMTSPETVFVSGPESEVGRISSVGIEIETEGIKKDADGKAIPILYDANGNVIQLPNVTVSPQEINFTVNVHKTKEITLLSSVTGKPAAGYQYESTTVAPGSIMIASTESRTNQLTVLELPEIDISSATSDVTRTFDVTQSLPAGVEIAQNESQVTVTVRIEKIPETETVAESTTAANSETTVKNESGPVESITHAETTHAETTLAAETEASDESESAQNTEKTEGTTAVETAAANGN